jgi:peptide deformylase
MILPITAYGDSVLRKECRAIEQNELDLKTIVQNMFDTMYHAHGVGLAAPQVGMDIRLFVVDGSPFNDVENEEDKDPSLEGFKKVFINAEILEESGDDWGFEEGCLSIPGVRGLVYRPEFVTIKYRDENWVEHTETFEGLAARIIQHEYDHIDGILFTDYLPPLKKRMVQKKLSEISKGIVSAEYKMRFAK